MTRIVDWAGIHVVIVHRCDFGTAAELRAGFIGVEAIGQRRAQVDTLGVRNPDRGVHVMQNDPLAIFPKVVLADVEQHETRIENAVLVAPQRRHAAASPFGQRRHRQFAAEFRQAAYPRPPQIVVSGLGPALEQIHRRACEQGAAGAIQIAAEQIEQVDGPLAHAMARPDHRDRS